jgi:hypothetical protein
VKGVCAKEGQLYARKDNEELTFKPHGLGRPILFLVMQLEISGDDRFYLYGLPMKCCGLVDPLFSSVESRTRQQLISFLTRELLDGAVSGNDDMQF